MELRHLRYFIAVAEHGTVTAAARAVLVAQPSLSRQLGRLEGELGVTLFHHGSGRLRLTPAGLEFLAMARDLVSRADSAMAAAAALATGTVARLTVAAPVTTIADVVAPFIAQTDAAEPMITVREVLPDDAYKALHEGADLAISTTAAPRELATRPLARLPVLAYVTPGHPLAARAAVALDTLAGHPLLLLTPEHRTRREFDHAAQRAGVRYSVAFETSSPQVAQALAAAGHGVAVVSDDPRYGLVPLSILPGEGRLEIELFAAWDPAHYAGRVVETLAARLGAFIVRRYGAAAQPPVPVPAPAPASARSSVDRSVQRARGPLS